MTASDLAEYAFCPRAHWYRLHPPAGGAAVSSELARRSGDRFHARVLTARTRRDRWTGLWWLLVGAGFLLCLLALVEFSRP